jgi:mannose-6-phosphate isomerase
MTQPLYPLRFKEILRNYGFGDRWIPEVFAKTGLPEDHRIAETWEFCDRPQESSEVINGPLAGLTLHDLIAQYGKRLLGSEIVASFGMRFPLLIKFLDSSNPLGEQVHQNDELARAMGLQDPGKTEAWYMLHVRGGQSTSGGASVHCGNVPGVTREQARQAMFDGTIRDYMQEHFVQPGDAFLLYAGTMHYSHGGVLFYEIMQNSDVGLPLRRWPGRPGYPQRTEEEQARTLMQAAEAIHLEEGFDCRTRPVVLKEGENVRTYVMACQHFAVERLDLAAPYTLTHDGRHFHALSQVQGRSLVRSGNGGPEVELGPGLSCLVAAELGQVTIEPSPEASILVAYVPNLIADIVQPLRNAGVSDRAIAALGGVTELNPLPALL